MGLFTRFAMSLAHKTYKSKNLIQIVSFLFQSFLVITVLITHWQKHKIRLFIEGSWWVQRLSVYGAVDREHK